MQIFAVALAIGPTVALHGIVVEQQQRHAHCDRGHARPKRDRPDDKHRACTPLGRHRQRDLKFRGQSVHRHNFATLRHEAALANANGVRAGTHFDLDRCNTDGPVVNPQLGAGRIGFDPEDRDRPFLRRDALRQRSGPVGQHFPHLLQPADFANVVSGAHQAPVFATCLKRKTIERIDTPHGPAHNEVRARAVGNRLCALGWHAPRWL